MAAPMEKKLSPALEELLTNSPEVFLDASQTLLKIATNILHHAEIDLYRQLRLNNPIIEAKLLAIPGAMECLFEMGFEEDGEFLRYPRTKSLDILIEFHSQLKVEREKKLKESPKKTDDGDLPSLPPPPARDRTQDSIGPQRADLAAKLSGLVTEQNFFHKLQSNMLQVLLYEDKTLQQKALSLIPLQDFLKTSGQKATAAKATAQNGEKPMDMRDFLVLELLNWFKHSFFKWVDSPECCGKATERRGMLEPTPAEKQYGASRVEGFHCPRCRQEVRFPRYNHPGKLLETRRGRCGEWANCFTLCCRAVGFDARFVLDWTDHVWSEVYSHSQSRWIHCDPCENAFDKPLMYESGWGKKLSYIVAFSKDDIRDVTWRYTTNFDLVLKRRRECREEWLVDTVLRMRERRQSSLDEVRRTELLNRSLLELTELMTPKTVDGDYQGRTSGSLSWRLSRGETGTAPIKNPHIIKPRPSDIQQKSLSLKYNAADDSYQFSNGEKTAHWDSIVHQRENVFRKEEQDWKMVYLAISEGKESGTLSWKFDLSECDLSIDKVTVHCESTTFEKGRVSWRLCGKDSCVALFPGRPLTTDDFSGEKELTLKAVLTAGQGSSGWQHAQLFRQRLDDRTATGLDVKLTFK